MSELLLAGASGMLGRRLMPALHARGHRVRAMTRTPERLGPSPHAEPIAGDLADAGSLRRACAGADVVVSCAGASMRLDVWGDHRGFTEVDLEGNRRLLSAARDAGARRFVYVGVCGGERLMHTEYAAAHERFAREVEESGLEWAVVKPTGFFGFFDQVLRMAARGAGPVVGSGRARTNPVHEADVAEVVADAASGLSGEIPVGGPEVLTRREIVELAFQATRRPARIVHLPATVLRAASGTAGLFNRRIGALMRFGVEVSLVDCVAPVGGPRRIEDYFRLRANPGIAAGVPELAMI